MKLIPRIITCLVPSRNLRHRLRDRFYLYEIKSKFPKILSFDKMLEQIYNGASLARLGDGEFNLAMGKDVSFQTAEPKLVHELKQILERETNDKLIIAIPPFNPISSTKNVYNWRKSTGKVKGGTSNYFTIFPKN